MIHYNILIGIALRGYDARSLDAVILYAGVQVKAFRLVYSYDINTSYLNGFNTGTHEISVAVPGSNNILPDCQGFGGLGVKWTR